jgi:hypothetical protein
LEAAAFHLIIFRSGRRGATPIAQIKYARCALTARELPVYQSLRFPWRVVQHELQRNALPRQPAPARTSSSCSFSSRLVSVIQVIRPRRVFNSPVGNFALYIVLYVICCTSAAAQFVFARMPMKITWPEPGQLTHQRCFALVHFASPINTPHSSFRGKIYCSEITRRLLLLKHPAMPPGNIVALELNVPHAIPLQPAGTLVTCTLIDANHCPGATMLHAR